MSRLLLLAVLLFLCGERFLAHGLSASPRTIRALGEEYVLLKPLAQRWQLSLQWNKKDDELRATNKTTSLRFKLNSQRAEINGIDTFLSFPLLAHHGEAYLASKDVDHLLEPILRPPRNKPGQQVKTIALCPGHGGKDVGFQVGSDQEKKYTLLLAKEVQKLLLAAGFKVVMLRDSDRYVGLEDRALAAKRRRADLYVSLHYNSAGPHLAEVRGCEVYCLPLPGSQSTHGNNSRSVLAEPGNRNDDQNFLLAYQMQKSLVRTLGVADRGVRRARFVVLRLAEMPAVLVEAAFMSNPDEMKRIKEPAHRKRTAQAIVDALNSYKRLVERR